MSTYTFALIEARPSNAAGNPVAGPVQGLIGGYSTALRALMTSYWEDMSGGRVEVDWFTQVSVAVPLGAAQWTNVVPTPNNPNPNRRRIRLAAAAAEVPDNVVPIVISNVANEPTGGVHVPGVGILLNARTLTPAGVAHEMGHYFQREGGRRGGHADVLRSFYRDEYADRTCIMGSDAGLMQGKYTFLEGSLPPLLDLNAATGTTAPILQPAGPGMSPVQADHCAWVDTASASVAVIDPNVLGSAVLQPWKGAARPGAPDGAPSVAVLDGQAPDNGRLYASVRERSGWDAGFWSFVGPWGAAGPRVYLHLGLPSGDSVLLGECPAVPGQSINAGAAPIELVVGRVSPEGVQVTFAQNPWRGWGVVEGVRCAPAARIAACTDGTAIDAFVIDENGTIRRNRYDGSGWEAGPWPALPGVTADPSGGIAAVRGAGGRIRVFVVGDDGIVHERRTKGGGWSTEWVDVPGVTLDPTSSLAAASVDGNGALLAASKPDGMVLRTYLGPAEPVTNWHTAPGFPRDTRAAVAAAPDDATRGRAFGISRTDSDRSVWSWPAIDNPRDDGWGSIGTLVCDRRSALAADVMRGASEVVCVGTDPITCLVRRGSVWVDEWPTPILRELEGGLAVVSRRHECIDLLAVDTSGRVTVTGRSPHIDYVVPTTQYIYRRTVALRAANGDWMTAKNGGGEGMGADAPNRREWETFTMHGLGTYLGDSGIELELCALQAYGGHFVSAKNGGGSHVTATATIIGPWEKFTLGFVPGAGITLRCIDESHFLVANGGGGGALSATATKEDGSTAAKGGAVFRLNIF